MATTLTTVICGRVRGRVRARAAAGLVALAACGVGCAPVVPRPACDEISNRCASATTDGGVACHHLGADPLTAELHCRARRNGCLKECAESEGVDAGHGH
ncbi:MAG: hypothetical protein HY904_10655 [Deltaproteobacteria bacterium]|nr:hypothetical protein [Deltaproteobacteria bacterium]